MLIPEVVERVRGMIQSEVKSRSSVALAYILDQRRNDSKSKVDAENW